MKTVLIHSVLAGVVILSPTIPVRAGNWPGWRGPSGTGITTDQGFPNTWSPNENVRWRVDLPERGNSSPVVWGNRVFVTQAISAENRRTLMCFDQADGKLLWQSGVTYTAPESTQRDNPYCSASPVTDGERVITSFGSAGLYCYDFTGKELWHRDLGKMEHMFGNAASPVLTSDLCVLNFGPDEKARLIAVNKRTGETVWEAQPPKVEGNDQPRGAGSGFGGPGGPGGPRGARGIGGGFGPGDIIAARLFSDADKNGDRKLTHDEFSGVAEAWFDKLDAQKTGKLDQQSFGERLGEVLPPPSGFAPRDSGAPAGGPAAAGEQAAEPRPGGRRGGFGRESFIAPGLFTAADTNKNGSLTREEWTATFTKWFAEWDKDNAGALDEAKLREGLNAALPRPQFGGPGGPGSFGGGRGRGPGGGGASWSTPLVITANGREELVASLPGSLAAFDPKTGQQLWFSKGLGSTIYTSPVFGENTLVAMNSGPGGGSAIAVRPGGNGDVTDGQRLWRLERFKSGIGTGVIHEGHLYTISQEGIAACTDLQSGKTVWEERLKASGSRGSSWSSMLLAEGKIYVPNQSGDVFVLRAAPKFELLATNAVGEATNASLAASDGEIFLRTDKALWCFGTAKP